MPEAESNKELANDFAKFFHDKITGIRDHLASVPLYVPVESNSTKLSQFQKLTEGDVEKIIASMKTKSSEMDVLPTNF